MEKQQVWTQKDKRWVLVPAGTTEEFQHYNGDEIDSSENLIGIPHLNEPSILNGIDLRFRNDQIYTWTGPILLSVNPFKNLGLYDCNHQYSGPHIYKISSLAMKELRDTNQTILISGESGAGKTYITREIMKHINHVNGRNDTTIVQTNPILEAFGNAATVRNSNSSRFGKFIEMKFENRSLQGAQISTYLLETVRVVGQNPGERNFHIFYQAIASGKVPQADYQFLEGTVLDSDRSDFEKVLSAFESLGFSDQQVGKYLDTVHSILLLGQQQFPGEGIEIPLEIDLSVLYQKQIKVGQEVFHKDLTPQQSSETRNTLCKRLYHKMFREIVEGINKHLDCSGQKFIGILDIFGFESFQTNRFEQLCINYTNEALQQQFNVYIFKKEFEEYAAEGIDTVDISYPDNQEIIQLIAGKRGVIDLLNEECYLPRGSSKNFTSRITKTQSQHPCFSSNRRFADKRFTIHHYAGPVEYTTENFMEKNADVVSPELCLAIGEPIPEKRPKTVAYNFRKQLKELLNIISETSPNYIRCIKPNDQNVQGVFDHLRVNDQLKYSGILQAVEISRTGYPVRLSHELFNHQFKCLPDWKSLTTEYQIGQTKVFLKEEAYNLLITHRNRKLFHFVQAIQKHYRRLATQKWYQRLRIASVTIQKMYRVMAARRYVYKVRQTLKIQTWWRKSREVDIYNKILYAVGKIQILWSNYTSRKHSKLVRQAIKIQRFYRSHMGIWWDRQKLIEAAEAQEQARILEESEQERILEEAAEQERILKETEKRKRQQEKQQERVHMQHEDQLSKMMELEYIKQEKEELYVQEIQESKQIINHLLVEQEKKLNEISELHMYKDEMKRVIDEKVELMERIALLERRQHVQKKECVIQ